MPRPRQCQLRDGLEAVLRAINVEAPDPINVDVHRSRRDIAASPYSTDFPLVLIERIQLRIHISHDALSVVVACLDYPERVTNSIRRYALENRALQITPDSR